MKKLLLLISPVALFFLPGVVSAHAFGGGKTLPLPTGFYVWGGVAAFVISCVFIFFVRRRERNPREYTVSPPTSVWSGIEIFLKVVFVAFFIYALALGFLGEQVDENPIIFWFWIALVLIMPYVSTVVSGGWEIANPFKTLVHLVSPRETRRVWEGEYFPALMGYGVFIIFELFLQNIAVVPNILASVLIGYVVYLWVGSLRWGASWLKHADFFSVFFALAGKLSPLRVEEGKIIFASPATRLMAEIPTDLSLVAFITTTLAATAFDGFHDSRLMWDIIFSLSSNFYVLLFITFLIFILFFFAAFAVAMAAMKLLAKGERSVSEYLLRFAYSLIPIVLAYHFAHYFSLLTASLGITLSVITIWYTQWSVIVAGHIFAAYVGHRIALQEFTQTKRAIISQIPLMVLMILYTAFGLWILAQPFAQNAL